MARQSEELQKLWLTSLRHERRASPNTLRAYGDDVSRFLGFQRGHLGGALSEKALAKLKPADIRAFIAARRSEGRWRRSAASTNSLPARAFWKMPRRDPCARRASNAVCRVP